MAWHIFKLWIKAEKNLFAVSENNFRREYDSMQTLVRDAIKDIQTARDHEGNLRGIPSGFTDLDRITSGWQKSDLIILAARPGMGKTALLSEIARQANEEGHYVIPREMDATQPLHEQFINVIAIASSIIYTSFSWFSVLTHYKSLLRLYFTLGVC